MGQWQREVCIAVTAILGISAFYHDAAAALVVDGRIVAAAQEERFSRKKHDPSFPSAAIDFCLQHAGLRPDEIDYVAFYDKPLLKFDRLIETYIGFAPRGFRSFAHAIPVWLRQKLHLRRQLARIGGMRVCCPQVFLQHHESHAASAFFPSPFEEAAILTVDGVGEWATATVGVGQGRRIRLLTQLNFPHSLGLLYSAFTYYCGFKVNSGEYKLMGLAPYGRPRFVDAICRHLIDLKRDGSLRLNLDYFNYCTGLTMTNRRFDRLFGGRPRTPNEPIEQRHMDLAASIQAVTEEAIVRMAAEAKRRTGQRNLVLAGGVALNCVANGRLLREGIFDNLWIQPAAGDAGGALGAALFVWHQLLEKPRQPSPLDSQHGSFLGPQFSNEQIVAFLDSKQIPYEVVTNEIELCRCVAQWLSEGKVVGWFQGRMEYGPRALGGRSIVADPRSPEMQSVLNLKIKYRESFRPFAPAVLIEHVADWFDWRPDRDSPYMLFTAPVRDQHRLPLTVADRVVLASDPDLRRRVNVPRSTIPAVTHVDYSARLQTVDTIRHPRFHRLIQEFYRLTGCPMLVNTSFNIRGEPIVCTPEDAWRCFLGTDMDILVIEDCIVRKSAEERSKLAGVQ